MQRYSRCRGARSELGRDTGMVGRDAPRLLGAVLASLGLAYPKFRRGGIVKEAVHNLLSSWQIARPTARPLALTLLSSFCHRRAPPGTAWLCTALALHALCIPPNWY